MSFQRQRISSDYNIPAAEVKSAILGPTMSVETTTTAEPGLRERKKQQTRMHIAQTARRLFGERGFDAVTVGEVARAADVSEKTVFNYFPTKEDLFYSGMEAFEEQLLGAIREREPGESVLGAFRRFVLEPQGVFAMKGSARELRERLEGTTRVIAESPALRARERAVLARYTDALAALIAADTGDDPEDVRPFVVAHAMLGVHQALIAFVRGRVLSGAPVARIAGDLRAQGEAALDLLEAGLGDYALKRG
jgi:AcrR family transcriptional regulator